MSVRRRSRGRGWRVLIGRNGGALVVALMVLVGLTAVALALLSISAQEPQISRNHVDMVRARYLAEAGIEHAYDILVLNAGAWDAYLTGATCTTGAALPGSTLPGRAPAHGRFTVLLRNDCAPGDERLTGVPLESVADAVRDTNGKVLVVSTGVIGATNHTITAIVSDNRAVRAPSQSVLRSDLTTFSWSDK